MPEKRIVIIGGGLAGLITSIHLARRGVISFVVEKQGYPFHRVCGEYISNEVVPYLRSIDAYPDSLTPSKIARFQLTSTSGTSGELQLDLGGFGISRHAFDYFLYQKAMAMGVRFLLHTEVTSIEFIKEKFLLGTSSDPLDADVVVGSFGKRSRLDKQLDRAFIQKRSPYAAVKYHIRLHDFPADLIALHNFHNGYCGISRVEDDKINLCYLTHRDNLRANGSIQSMEESVLFRNPFIRNIFDKAEFLFDKPETINEISFETKSPLENHVLMSGDAAGMITPLCGNGMAMAIQSAKLVSEHVIRYCGEDNYSREKMERDYQDAWKKHFGARLWAGRQIQRLFGSDWTSNLAVNLTRNVRPVANYLMKKTHGKTF